MRGIDFEGLCRRLGFSTKRNSLLVSVEEATERVLEVTGEIDNLSLRLHNYNV